MSKLTSSYGMLVVLVGLCIFFSCVTIVDQFPEGEEAAEALLTKIEAVGDKSQTVLIVTKKRIC